MDHSEVKPSRSRRKEARPAELLAAALDCFVEKGFAATRMDDIAKRAGVAKGTFYLYFPSKQVIFEALVRENMLPRMRLLEAAVAADGRSAEERLQGLLTVFGRLIAEPRLVAIPKLVVTEAGNFPDMARFYLHEVVERAMGLVKGLLEDGVRRGEFRPLPAPELSARLFVAPILLTALWQSSFALVDEKKLPPQAVLSAHADHFLRSIRADNGQGAPS